MKKIIKAVLVTVVVSFVFANFGIAKITTKKTFKTGPKTIANLGDNPWIEFVFLNNPEKNPMFLHPSFINAKTGKF